MFFVTLGLRYGYGTLTVCGSVVQVMSVSFRHLFISMFRHIIVQYATLNSNVSIEFLHVSVFQSVMLCSPVISKGSIQIGLTLQ